MTWWLLALLGLLLGALLLFLLPVIVLAIAWLGDRAGIHDVFAPKSPDRTSRTRPDQ